MENLSNHFPEDHFEASIDLDVQCEPVSESRFPRWQLIGAAAVFLTVLGALAFIIRDRADFDPRDIRASDDAAAVLRAAAAAAERSPEGVPQGGQARLNVTRQFMLMVSPSAGGGYESFRSDLLVEEWVPADLQAEWLYRMREPESTELWDLGWESPALSKGTTVTEHSGRCGEYFPAPDQDPCIREGLWQDPTPAFLAGLPSEPHELLARLRADAPPDAVVPDQEALLFVGSALERWVPPKVRADLYRAIALIPGLKVAKGSVDLGDGRTGVAVGLDAQGVEVELAVEPDKGEHLGWRRVLTAPQDGLESGTVMAMSIFRTAVVGAVGQRPHAQSR